MKRDMDLIRRITLELDDLGHGKAMAGLDGVDKADFAMHVVWMEEAGLIKAAIQEYFSGETPSVHVQRLTWAGCEFADAVRSDTLWKKAKDNVMKPSMSFTFDVLKDWLKTEIAQGLPTIRALGQ